MALLTTMSTAPILNMLGVDGYRLIKPLPPDHSEI